MKRAADGQVAVKGHSCQETNLTDACGMEEIHLQEAASNRDRLLFHWWDWRSCWEWWLWYTRFQKGKDTDEIIYGIVKSSIQPDCKKINRFPMTIKIQMKSKGKKYRSLPSWIWGKSVMTNLVAADRSISPAELPVNKGKGTHQLKEIKPVSPKGNQPWRTDAEAEAPILWPPDAKSQLIGKDPDARKDWRPEEKGTTEDEMVGWHHQLNGHGFEQTQRDGEGQGSLACCSPWGCKDLDTT